MAAFNKKRPYQKECAKREFSVPRLPNQEGKPTASDGGAPISMGLSAAPIGSREQRAELFSLRFYRTSYYFILLLLLIRVLFQYTLYV